MDYKKASQIRKKGLLSLIAEKKFEQGQGLGSSIGGAISDKFKAKATGMKESLDPLKWVSSLTGKGTFGKVATTIAGRAFGRSEDTIEYFGGYGRKRKSKNKRDASHSTIGPGSATSLKVGDSESNILAKMYNFMEKTHEVQKKTYEIELAFREEEKAEDERRHKKLIDSILGRKTSNEPTKEKEKEDTSWIEKFIDSIKMALGFLISPIIKWAEKFNLKNLIKVVSSVIFSALTAPTQILKMVASTLFGLLTTPIKALILAVAGALITTASYENWRSEGSKARESKNQSEALKKGPSVKKGEMTDGLERSIENEYKQDYLDGKLGYYNGVIIPNTGGKKADFLLTDEEKNSLQSLFSDLSQNQALLDKYNKNELGVDPKSFPIDKLKQSIADQILYISKIQQKGLSRLNFQNNKEGMIDKFAYSNRKAMDDLNNNVLMFGKEDAKDEINKSFLEKERDSFIEKIVNSIPDISFPKLDLNDFKIPNILPDDFPVIDGEWNNADKVVSFNSTNNIGGSKPQTFNTASVKVRNDDIRRYNVNNAQVV